MSGGVPPKLQAGARMRAVLAGTLAGLLAFVIWKTWPVHDLSQASALRLVGTSFALSAAAGFLAALIVPLGRLYKSDVVSVTADAGLRSGIIAALVCSGAIITDAVIKTFAAPTHTADLYLRALTWHTAFVLFAALFSSVPAGVIGSIGGLSLRKPTIAQHVVAGILGGSGSAHNTDRQRTDASMWFTRILASVSIAGMLSPVLLLLRPVKVDPPPVIERRPPGPPPFHYDKPRSFDYAEPDQFVIAARKFIPVAAGDRPMLFSSDSELFAYCPANSGQATVAVWDLSKFEEVATFALSARPNHMAWSPDFRRILYISEGRMGVLNLENSGVTELPQPKNRDLPGGQPAWWLTTQVAFYPTDEPTQSLDLDTLLLIRLDESSSFKATDTTIQNRLKSPPPLDFPKREAWQMTVDVAIQSLNTPPRKEPSGPWNYNGFATLAFKGITKPTIQWMPQIAIQPGQLVLPAPDGSKLIHHTGNQTEVIYFGTRENVASVVSFPMPITRDWKKDDPDLLALIKHHDLCAFVYAPLVNPLNGKIVGPNREHVRAILRVIRWLGDSADFWTAEQFNDLADNDVVADLHTWEGGRFTPATHITDGTWWTPFARPRHSDDDAIPSTVAAEDLDTGLHADITRQTYAFQFEKFSHSTHEPKPQVRAESAPPQKPPPPELVKVPDKPVIPQDDIEKFVLRHHQLAHEGNIDGLIADYDDALEYLGQWVPRSTIESDEIEYHAKWNRVEETPLKPITATQDGHRFRASYTVDFRTESTKENRWVSGKNDLTLLLEPVPGGGFKIDKQEAAIHDRKEGFLVETKPAPNPAVPANKGGPPPVAITVPVPRWVAQFTVKVNADSSPLEMTDAIHLANGSLIIQRTFRRIGANGKVLATCTIVYQGTAQQQGGSVVIAVTQNGWVPGGDKALMRLVGPNTDTLVGTTVAFTISGENLISPEGGIFRPLP